MDFPELPAEIGQRLDELLHQSGIAQQAGDLKNAALLSLAAWNLMPEPRENWDFYPQIIATALVENYTQLKDLSLTQQWIETLHAAYSDSSRTNVYVNMIAGKALLELEDMDGAWQAFDRIYQVGRQKWFQGEDPRYLAFYLEKKN